MAHVDNTNRDFDGLEAMSPDIQKKVKLARIEARSIIDQLEPFHISSWIDLKNKLKEALWKVSVQMELQQSIHEE
jgi:hypothetical protein